MPAKAMVEVPHSNQDMVIIDSYLGFVAKIATVQEIFLKRFSLLLSVTLN